MAAPLREQRIPITLASWPKLKIRVPFSTEGSGDEWQEHIDDVFDALDEAMESSGAGVADDPEPFEGYLCFYEGGDVAALVEAAVQCWIVTGCSIVPSAFRLIPRSTAWTSV